MTPTVNMTFFDHIAENAASNPEGIAIDAHGRLSLTNRALAAHLSEIRKALRAAGISRQDRVAIVLPAGPELATVVLGVMQAAIAVPMNPDLKTAEYEQSLQRLAPKLLISLVGENHPVSGAADSLGLPTLKLELTSVLAAGCFKFCSPPPPEATFDDRPPLPSELALILQTSGTTSIPKTVPLTHENLLASAQNMVRSLSLTESDRCLHFLPMFHIGGIVDVLMTPLLVGGSTVVQPSFSTPDFYRDLVVFKPTWTQAVPVMLQELVNTAQDNAHSLSGHSLRFIRSVSAPLSVSLMSAAESTFSVPVIEIFGMTETAGVITSNPLPPARRIPGSVGISAGMSVRIVDSDNNDQASGIEGEVVVAGSNLMAGYESDPEENERLFSSVGFRTGDLGFLDADGYLYLTGRVKDIINRGGEKVSPYEVDTILLKHPKVLDAASFPVTHPTLGEDVAAVVTLRPGSTLDSQELQSYLRDRLAFFKIPRSIQIVEEIPRGANGKLQRGSLAALFAVQNHVVPPEQSDFVPPEDPVSRVIAGMWAEILKCKQVGMNDDFFAIGGESLRAASFINALQRDYGETIYVSSIFDEPTLRGYSQYIKRYYPAIAAKMIGAAVVPPEGVIGRLTNEMTALVETHIQGQRESWFAPIAKNRRRVIFVLSTPRTGSTLFRAMLAGHPELFSPPELYLLPYESLTTRKSNPWFTGSQRNQLEGNVRALMEIHNESANASLERMEVLEKSDISVQDYYAMLQDWIAPRVLVDKTPAYSLDIENLRRAEAMFDDVFYIYLKRHPYGMIRSFEEARLDQLWMQRVFGNEVFKSGQPPMHPRQFAEAIWYVIHQNIHQFLSEIPTERKIGMKFEDVVYEPESQMRVLCEKLAIDFSFEMLRPQAEKRHRMTDGLHDVSRMIGDPKFHQFDRIEASIADQWKDAYEVDFLSEKTLALANQLGYSETVASVKGREEFEL
jgi:acyl-CoA synthetase (AMP-forming)/AMP-acid ligase II